MVHAAPAREAAPPEMQVPPEHVWPAAQARAHAPQLSGSAETSVQAVPHMRRGEAQVVVLTQLPPAQL